ncbi:MAG: cation diffusion facilitator family transporter [Bacillota bacterium]|nr:cation diffusion facilitator family transporter [Bacillota bacterium]
MAHGHNYSGHNHGNKNIKTAFFLNLGFTVIEIIGGLWTNSMAILSDALHDLGDSLSLGVSWYLQNYSKKGPDYKFSFGYSRFSLLGALINSIVLLGGSVLILSRAVPRIFNPQPVNAKGMIVFAVLGIIINGAAVLKLRKGTSLNEKVVTWHLLEDVLGWVVVLIGSIILNFKDIPVIDPLLSLGITIYILINVVKNLKKVLNVFLQGVPENISIEEIESKITENTKAISAHHTHIWTIEGERNMLSTHIKIPDDYNSDEIVQLKKSIRKILTEKNIEHVTIEIEFESEDCEGKMFE